VFVLFVAGHGKTENGVYYFLPPGFKNVGVKPLERQGISAAVWDSWIAKVEADKSLLIYDTCESGTLASGARKDGDRNDEIDITELYNYVGVRVPEISCEMTPPRPGRDKCYKQVPQASLASKGSSFPLLPRFAAADPNMLLVRRDASPVSPIGQPASREKTHVVTTETDLLDAPGGKVLRRLAVRYAVLKVSVENGFALIARDGMMIGYVEERKLAELE
jgi:hypothetical protein